MGRFARSLAASAVLLLAAAGCLCPEKVELAAVHNTWRDVSPEFQAYVKADPKLKDWEKEARLKAAERLDQVVAGYFKAK